VKREIKKYTIFGKNIPFLMVVWMVVGVVGMVVSVLG
jgi:hypothetical protein